MFKKLILGCLLLSIIIINGCGGATGGSTTLNHIPSISSLSYSPTVAALNSGGGAVSISGYADFIDNGGDLDKIGLQSSLMSEPKYVTLSSSSLKSGQVGLLSSFSTATKQTITFQVWLVDKEGSVSNKLNGSIIIN